MGLKSGKHAFKFGSDTFIMDVAYDDADHAVFVSDEQLEAMVTFSGRRISAAAVYVDGAHRNQVNGETFNGAADPEARARTAKILPFRRAS